VCSRLGLALLLSLLPASSACSGGAGGVEGNPRDAGRPSLETSVDDRSDPGAKSNDASPISSCDAELTCSGSPREGQSCVGTVDARLVDPTGAPASGIVVTVCGTDLCSEPVQSDASGRTHLSLCLFMTSASFRVFDDPVWSSFAVRLPADPRAVSLGNVTVTPLPAKGAAFPPAGQGGSVSSNGVTLEVAPNSVTFDGEHQALGTNALEFRAVEITTVPPDLSGASVTAAWGLAPLNTVLAPGATLTIPNTKGWSALTEVDFYLDGTDESPTALAPWGEWGSVGVGAVSSDGSVITLAATGGGLREIGLIGLVLH
jgi:hypothetical protein